MPNNTHTPRAPRTMPARAPKGAKPFPYQHSTQKPGTTPGSVNDVLKIARDSLFAYFGRPSSYKSVPITAMFSNFGLAGEKPDVRARLLGYSSAADQQAEIQRMENAKRLGVPFVPRTKRPR